MAYRIENALDFAPGVILGELDCGGMVIDRNSGEYLPIDQVLKDPNHIDQLDILDESHRGFLKLALCDDEAVTTDDSTDDSAHDSEGLSRGRPAPSAP